MTATMTTELGVEIQPVPCAPWCRDGDMHVRWSPEDRDCWSEGEGVPLSHQRAVKIDDNRWRRPLVEVCLRRIGGESEALVYIHSEDTDRPEFQFTLEDATKLRDQLSELISTAARAGR